MFSALCAIPNFEYWTGPITLLGLWSYYSLDMEGYDSERESLQNESQDASPECLH